MTTLTSGIEHGVFRQADPAAGGAAPAPTTPPLAPDPATAADKKATYIVIGFGETSVPDRLVTHELYPDNPEIWTRRFGVGFPILGHPQWSLGLRHESLGKLSDSGPRFGFSGGGDITGRHSFYKLENHPLTSDTLESPSLSEQDSMTRYTETALGLRARAGAISLWGDKKNILVGGFVFAGLEGIIRENSIGKIYMTNLNNPVDISGDNRPETSLDLTLGGGVELGSRLVRLTFDASYEKFITTPGERDLAAQRGGSAQRLSGLDYGAGYVFDQKNPKGNLLLRAALTVFIPTKKTKTDDSGTGTGAAAATPDPRMPE